MIVLENLLKELIKNKELDKKIWINDYVFFKVWQSENVTDRYSLLVHCPQEFSFSGVSTLVNKNDYSIYEAICRITKDCYSKFIKIE